jgi:hypothetical protein
LMQKLAENPQNARFLKKKQSKEWI